MCTLYSVQDLFMLKLSNTYPLWTSPDPVCKLTFFSLVHNQSIKTKKDLTHSYIFIIVKSKMNLHLFAGDVYSIMHCFILTGLWRPGCVWDLLGVGTCCLSWLLWTCAKVRILEMFYLVIKKIENKRISIIWILQQKIP